MTSHLTEMGTNGKTETLRGGAKGHGCGAGTRTPGSASPGTRPTHQTAGQGRRWAPLKPGNNLGSGMHSFRPALQEPLPTRRVPNPQGAYRAPGAATRPPDPEVCSTPVPLSPTLHPQGHRRFLGTSDPGRNPSVLDKKGYMGSAVRTPPLPPATQPRVRMPGQCLSLQRLLEYHPPHDGALTTP